MRSAPWDMKTETITEYCERRVRENREALRAAPTFRYETAPSLVVRYRCNGDECGLDSIVQDDDVLVCTDCKTRWGSNEWYDGVDGELLADQGELSAEAIDALPIKDEW
ncbi:hypothetical protein Mbo4_043 [Rhodococcus phage Mbo4]|uniref:Uncharacterized protein n=2 Tax=root TaxID=1 RepID=A0A9E7INB4_9CAUD|nr:hypothetical protein [Rhodococcus opacus]YP_010755948.1 hypothetical protein QEH50_gp43 [Rhodococcus phage Mbo4]EKT83074.1 hypothetical protein WSS_A09162 [Rhodococcus opacus M213]URG17533.1 hypothetical protein Mbo4_043 [Rhodococcus phage Mbo4]